MNEEIVLGVDLSNTETGYCLSKDGKISDYGTIKPSSTLSPIDKLVYVIEEIQKLIKKFNVDELVIEDIYCGYIQAFLILGRLQGAIILVWHKLKLRPPIIYRTTTARCTIGIKGNAKKKDVMEAINKRLGLKITNDNISDAIVLILTYLKEKELGRTR